MISVKAISGMGGKSPACFLVETGKARFLLDLGEGPAPGMFPDVSGVGVVDAILISHGHADHIGGLHLAAQLGNPPIYATAMTRAFAGHRSLDAAQDLPLRGGIEIAGTVIETGRAGHAAGGVWIRVGGSDGVLYTGDLCRESLLYPVDPPPPAAVLIADASYGTYDADLTLVARQLLDRASTQPILLPLPPTGRGVEIAILMHEAGLPIAICDQHRRIAELMLAAAPQTLTPDGPARLTAMLDHAGMLSDATLPEGVMIAANGGATGGLAKTLLDRFLPNPAVAIFMTGHVEDGNTAHQAIVAGRADALRWNVHPRFRDLVWIKQAVRPSQMLLAFCTDSQAEATAQALNAA